MLEQSLTHLGGGAAIGRVEGFPLARRETLGQLASAGGEAKRVGRVGARQRHEHLHGGVGGKLAAAHKVLDWFGQPLHQGKAPGEPAHRVAAAPGQIAQRKPVGSMDLLDEPPLLQGRAGPGEIEPVGEQERLGLGQVQEQSLHDLPSKGLDRLDPTVPVDQHEERLLTDDEHRGLLVSLRDRRRHPGLARRIRDPKRLIAKHELMELDLHRVNPPPTWHPV